MSIKTERGTFLLLFYKRYISATTTTKKKATSLKGLKSLLMDSLVQFDCTKLLSIGGKVKFKGAKLTQMDTLV